MVKGDVLDRGVRCIMICFVVLVVSLYWTAYLWSNFSRGCICNESKSETSERLTCLFYNAEVNFSSIFFYYSKPSVIIPVPNHLGKFQDKTESTLND